MLALAGVVALCGVPGMLLVAGAPDGGTWHRLQAWRVGATFAGFEGVVRQQRADDCGAAVLLMALRQFGVDAAPAEVYAALTFEEGGVSLATLRDGARRFGLTAEGWRLTPEVLPNLLPTVLFVGGDHFVLATRQLPGGSIEVLDPARGRLLYTPRQLRRRWRGEALVFCRPDSAWQCTPPADPTASHSGAPFLEQEVEP